MVCANHWLSSSKINRLSWYLTLVSANQASNNSAVVELLDANTLFIDSSTGGIKPEGHLDSHQVIDMRSVVKSA